MSQTTILAPSPFKGRPEPDAALPKSLKLSTRLVLAMVLIGFLSAIIGGVFYQVQVNRTIQKIDTRVTSQVVDDVIARLQNSRLSQAVINQTTAYLESRKNEVTLRPILDLALDTSVWIILAAALLVSGVAFIVGWLLTRRIIRRLELVRRASLRVAAGDFNISLPVDKFDEIGQVSYAFGLMSQALQRAEVKRRELLSDVAHELKTPLASIQGHVEALRDNLPRARANPDQIYQIVLEDVEDLNRMIGSLRTWLNSQGTVENMNLEPLSLSAELGDVTERFRSRADSARIHLEMRVDSQADRVKADRNALRQVVSNLVDNALRYTPAGGYVQVTSWPGEGERPGQGSPGRVTIAVRDTGVGIAREHWAHLFERFYRVDRSRTRDTGGTGLGLAIVRELVEAQGGRVWLNSQPGKGTIFFVTLPQA
jgi:signal transduction histidine kinase